MSFLSFVGAAFICVLLCLVSYGFFFLVMVVGAIGDQDRKSMWFIIGIGTAILSTGWYQFFTSILG
jgi:hypothetical protein